MKNKDCENDLLLWPLRDPPKSKRLRREASEWEEEEAENELKQEVGRTSLQSTLIFQALAEGGREEERERDGID